MQESDLEMAEDELQTPDELTTLKARADQMGITYHPSIKVEKLREKIAAKLAGEEEPKEPVTPDTGVSTASESAAQLRVRKKREASELVRIRVTCMNPLKKEWDGEMFTCGNSLVGTIRKFVPFNADDGWHVPRIIYNMMVQRQCQVFKTEKDSRGNKTRKGKLIKEFAIEVLPQLTEAERLDLAQRQAMARSID